MASKKKKGNLGGLSGPQANGDINVTPLIDVVLVLLIIFMVLTPIIIEEMPVNLPSKQKNDKPPPPDKKNKPLLVATCADGTFTLNRKPYELAELHKQVRRQLKNKKDSDERVVFVDGHPEAPYDNMIELMDTVRDAGAERVGLVRPKEDAADFTACTPLDATEQ